MLVLIPTPVLDLREMTNTCAPSFRMIGSDNTLNKLLHQASMKISSVDTINSTPALYSLKVTQPHQPTCLGHDLQPARQACPTEQLSLPSLPAQQPYRPEFEQAWSQLPDLPGHLAGRIPYPLATLPRGSFSQPDIPSLSQFPQYPANSQRGWQFINPQRAPPWPSLRDDAEEQQALTGLLETGTKTTSSVTHSTTSTKGKKRLNPEPSKEYFKDRKDDIARQLLGLQERIKELEQENSQLKAHGSRRLGAAQSFENTGLPTASQPVAQVNVPTTALHLTTMPLNQIQIRARSIDDLITFEVLPRFRCGICSQSFYEISRLEEHACRQSQTELYACARCFLKFRSSESAEAHVRWDRCRPTTSNPTLAAPKPMENEVDIFSSTPVFNNSTFRYGLYQLQFRK